MNDQRTLSQDLATFARDTRDDDIPQEVRRRAAMLLLDAVGVALAAAKLDYAQRVLAALQLLGEGDSDVIGMSQKLALRDAVLLNAALVHGLDYDETYLPGSIHLTASCVPTALGIGAATGASGRELITACAIGLEAGARLGAAARGGFLRAGFHATSIVGIFACTVVAGRLLRLSAGELTIAQGIALSMASGNMQPMQDASWTKRLHPGLAGASAITAARLAQQGFAGPLEAYEGRFGLYPCFLGRHAQGLDLGIVRGGLGKQWEFPRASVKLFPACHQSHAFFNAAIAIHEEEAVQPEDIESICVRIAEPAVPLVCEPLAAKRRPDSSYAAQFSLPYGVACCLVRGRFGLAEIEEASYSDPALLALARKVDYEIDPHAGFPRRRSGEVIVELRDGRKLGRRESIDPDEPAADEVIVDKFMQNTGALMPAVRAERLRDVLLALENLPDVRTLTAMLAQSGAAQDT